MKTIKVFVLFWKWILVGFWHSNFLEGGNLNIQNLERNGIQKFKEGVKFIPLQFQNSNREKLDFMIIEWHKSLD